MAFFWQCHRRRFDSMGRRPLQIEDVVAVVGLMGMTARRRIEYLWWHVLRLDDVWLQLAAEADERRREQQKLGAVA